MTSYRGDEAIDWFGFSRLWSQTVGYAVTTSRIDSLNRRKTLSKSLASARLLQAVDKAPLLRGFAMFSPVLLI